MAYWQLFNLLTHILFSLYPFNPLQLHQCAMLKPAVWQLILHLYVLIARVYRKSLILTHVALFAVQEFTQK